MISWETKMAHERPVAAQPPDSVIAMSVQGDPMEWLIASALSAAGIRFLVDGRADTKSLDFLLPDLNLYIEVKQFHSPRIAAQTARVDNVIVAQGRAAVEFLAALIRRGELSSHAPKKG